MKQPYVYVRMSHGAIGIKHLYMRHHNLIPDVYLLLPFVTLEYNSLNKTLLI